MKAKAVLAALEQSCQERGIKLIYDDLQTEGGLCRLRDNYYIIINRLASTETRVRILRDSLGRMGEVARVVARQKPVREQEAVGQEMAEARLVPPAADNIKENDRA
ncbi:MAG: hypothetical protein JSU73_03695 [candidate division WOR-3 bacterium]|nr:MAG: hypothetical protein JSU73_03695 [candidate division WOR-3 bacterium]